jgi:hypothetical protein
MEHNTKAKGNFLPIGKKYPANIAEKGANHAANHVSHTTTSKRANTQHDPCQSNKGEQANTGGIEQGQGTMGGTGTWEEQWGKNDDNHRRGQETGKPDFGGDKYRGGLSERE